MHLRLTPSWLLLTSTFVAASGQTTIEVRTFDERTHIGRIESWQLNGDLVLRQSDDTTGRVKTTDIDLIVLRHDAPASRAAAGSQPAVPEPPAPDVLWRLEGRSGARLRGRPVGGDERAVIWLHPWLGEIRLPIEGVRRIVRSIAGPAGAASGDQDALVLANGDLLRGAVGEINEEGVALLDADGAERRFPWRGVRAVAFADSRPVTPGPTARVDFLDDDRIDVHALSWQRDMITLGLGAAQVRVDPRRVARIEIAGGRRVRLGDLPPSGYQSIPFFSQTWVLRVDQNAVGGPLAIAGRRYARGLGLHSACEVEWRLDGQYQRFTALVGIDDSGGSLADADVTVFVDGKTVAELRGLRHAEAPRRIDVEVGGGRTLRIEVGFGRRGDVQDRVDLVDPVLIRK